MEFFCFTSAKGGVGTSHIMTKIAYSLSEIGYKCLLVDLHCERRAVDIYLDVSDSFIYDLNDVEDGKCDFENATVNINDNLDFVSCSQTRDFKNYESVFDIICDFGYRYDFVLADVPYACADSDKFTKTVIVTCCDKISVRCTEKLVQDLKNQQKYLIINKIDVDLILKDIFMNVDDICDICGIAPIGLIPYDRNYFLSCDISNDSLCNKTIENITSRLIGKSVVAIDFKDSKNKRKLFNRR